MRLFMHILGWSALGLLLAVLLAGSLLPRPLFDERLEDPRAGLELAPDAVTLTAVTTDAGRRLLLVLALDAAGVQGLDLTGHLPEGPTDLMALLAATTPDALMELAATAAIDATPVHDWAQLEAPWSAIGNGIAAGTNYQAHAEEVDLDDGPFLFPKVSAPTPWQASVTVRGRLDYEAEICALTLADAIPGRTGVPLGFAICNDFTDRWVLLRDIDLGAPMGTTGFAAAKGGPQMLPVGALLVIPRDPEAFLADLTLELAVDGELRQRSSASLMLWSPAQMLEEALVGCEVPYSAVSSTLRLADCDRIPAGTLLLTGTPGGVRFQPVNIWNPWAYLRPGDRVITRADHLGWLDNRIVAAREP